MEALRDLSQTAFASGSQVFRRVLSRFDHQVLRTPFTIRFSTADVEYVSVDGTFVATDRTDPSVSLPLAQGGYEAHLRDFYRTRLRPGMTVLDVGANVGIYSMLAASLVGPTGRVLSFEPNSENCRLILLGAAKNGFSNVEVLPMALSDKTGHAFFTTHIGSNGGFSPNAESVLADPGCVVVPTARLDDVVRQNVDFIKIDVEGAEGLVVGGAHALIDRCRPTITSEFSMEMLPRVSGMSCAEYLDYFRQLRYDTCMVDRASGRLIPIVDLKAFLASYGSIARIEDLVFLPQAL